MSLVSTARKKVLRRLKLSIITRICAGIVPTSCRYQSASVYVHWPYCKKLCSYCNFNKYVEPAVDDARMIRCMVRAVQGLLHLGQIKSVTSIYFGGGTPSLCKPQFIQEIIQAIDGKGKLMHDVEITLEANPTSMEINKMKDFKSAGINRLSIGIQALNQNDLKILDRDHTVTEALGALELAKSIFPRRTSIDLIFARPNQTSQEWLTEIEKAIGLCDNHISLYQLTLERGTKLYKQVKERQLHLPDEEAIAEMYEGAVTIMQQSGYYRYEVSNFAKSGAIGKHNVSYWKAQDYIGVGPGAHSRLTVPSMEHQRYAMVQCLAPNHWMKMVERGKLGMQKLQKQTPMERLTEFLLVGLRMDCGISRNRWDEIAPSNSSFDKVFHRFSSRSKGSYDIASDTWLDYCIRGGFITIDSNTIRPTSHGMSLLDQIIPGVVMHLEQHVVNES